MVLGRTDLLFVHQRTTTCWAFQSSRFYPSYGQRKSWYIREAQFQPLDRAGSNGLNCIHHCPILFLKFRPSKDLFEKLNLIKALASFFFKKKMPPDLFSLDAFFFKFLSIQDLFVSLNFKKAPDPFFLLKNTTNPSFFFQKHQFPFSLTALFSKFRPT